MLKKMSMVTFLLSFAFSLSAEDLKPVKLPAPQPGTGKTLMNVLKERRSSRSFSPRPIPDTVLSNLLWAACGVNRPGTGYRTAPSAKNLQEIDVYAAMGNGLFLYDARDHVLKPVLSEDIRALTGMQPFVAEAPLNLIYVADLSKMEGVSPENKALFSATDTGFISQNVYLFCASEGLATVVRGSIDRDSLARKMKLSGHQKIILAQTVGYPGE